MQIRSYLLRVLIPLCLLFAGGQVSGADQPPPPDAQQTSETAPASREAPVAADDVEEAADVELEEEPPVAGTVADQLGEVSLEEFVPSEEISADGAVSFPVDI